MIEEATSSSSSSSSSSYPKPNKKNAVQMPLDRPNKTNPSFPLSFFLSFFLSSSFSTSQSVRYTNHLSLRPNCPYLKRSPRQCSTLSRHTRLNAEASQTASDEACGEVQKRLDSGLTVCVSAEGRVSRLRDERGLHGSIVFFRVKRHAAEGLERIVGEDVDAAVVGLEVVDLLAEEERPEIFAQELDAVEGCCGARCVA
jgi:hypothetical protein